MPQRIKVGLVGGGIGSQHLEGFAACADMFEVVALCDLDRARAEKLAEQYNIAQVTDNFSVLCNNDDIDVIDICTPPFLHFLQITQALEAGKNVMCEKPLVSALAEIDMLENICKKTGKHILPIYQYRYGAGLQKLLFLKEYGLLGKPYMANIEVAWRRGADYFAVPWRGKKATHLGGCLADQSIHMHDMIMQLMGKISAVQVQMRTLVNAVETEDNAVVLMELENNALACEAVTLGATAEKTRLKFCFENLTAISDHDAPYKPQNEPWQFIPANEGVAQKIENALKEFKPTADSYAGLFYAYATARQEGSALPVTLSQARESIDLVTAMYKSAQTGQSVQTGLPVSDPFYHGWNSDLANQKEEEILEKLTA